MQTPDLNEMILLVIPHDENTPLENIDVGSSVEMRLVRYQDVLNGLVSVPPKRDARVRHITPDMLPTLRKLKLLQGDTPTGNVAQTRISP